MTQQITIEEIVRLDSERTQGLFIKVDNEIFADTRTYKDGLCEYGTLQLLETRYSMFEFEGDERLFLATPRIAAKAIALDKVNKELVEALKEIMSNKFSVLSEESATCMKIIAIEVLTKTGAL